MKINLDLLRKIMQRLNNLESKFEGLQSRLKKLEGRK